MSCPPPMTDLSDIVLHISANPTDMAAWGALHPAITRQAHRVLAELARKRPDLFEEVLEGVIDRAQTRLLNGENLGDNAGNFISGMLRNAATDTYRKQNAYGGARRRMADPEAEERAVEESPSGHRFPSPDEGIRQRELLQAVQAVLWEALSRRAERYRPELQDAWDFAARRALSGASIRAQVEEEGPELDPAGLRAEVERRTRAGQRLRDALLRVATEPGELPEKTALLIREFLIRLAGCPAGGGQAVLEWKPDQAKDPS